MVFLIALTMVGGLVLAGWACIVFFAASDVPDQFLLSQYAKKERLKRRGAILMVLGILALSLSIQLIAWEEEGRQPQVTVER